MTDCPLCRPDPAHNPSAPALGAGERPTGVRRAWRGAQWVFPTALMVLMPKCPMCVAGYLVLFTGVGMSVSTAGWIRIGVLGLCSIALAYLALTRVFRHGRLRAKRHYSTAPAS